MSRLFTNYIRTLLILVGLAGSALAQGVAPQTANPNNAATVRQHLGLETVEGCLSRTAGGYVITGGAPGAKQFRIISGDTSMLKGKLQHTIKVVGIVGKNDPAENQNGIYNEGSTTGVGYLTIEAQKIKDVYGNCSESGKEWVEDHEGK
jgi:hypothetical protein